MRAELIHFHHTVNPVESGQDAHDKSKICSTGFHFPFASRHLRYQSDKLQHGPDSQCLSQNQPEQRLPYKKF